jgi:two-component system nitrogen regulation sensor histidine kinase GlnL
MTRTALYSSMIENLNTTVLLFDRTLRLRYTNPAGEILFASSARQMRGMAAHTLMPDATAFTASMQRALASLHPFTERELQLRLADGTTSTLDAVVTPLSETELLLELSRVDQHLRITREEHLLAQHHAHRAVLRGLAHEINNPLGGLRGAAQLLERELPSEGLREYTRIIIGEADRLQNLLKRMLGPQGLPQRRATNIHEVLERVRSLVLAEVPDGVHIQRDYDVSIPELDADPEQLIQALLNIVRNAGQMLGEQGTIRLRTRIQRQSTIGQKHHRLVARVDIIDNGPGIPEHLIESIFYPMVTGRAEGSGLGLSIAQGLINQHGGLIECSSRPGETIFTLLLPTDNGVQP